MSDDKIVRVQCAVGTIGDLHFALVYVDGVLSFRSSPFGTREEAQREVDRLDVELARAPGTVSSGVVGDRNDPERKN